MFVLSTILRLNSTLWNRWKPFTSIKFSVYHIKRKQIMNSISWCLNHVGNKNKLTDTCCFYLYLWEDCTFLPGLRTVYVDVAISSDPAQLWWHCFDTQKCEFSIMFHRFNQWEQVHVNLLFYAPEIEDGEGGCCFCPVCHSVLSETLTFANKYWTVNARTLIFHMNIPCYKTFPWVPLFFTVWPWL